MAGEGEDDKEYESDPEEAKMSLKMRRREASDDEEGEGADDVGDADGEVEGRREKPIPPVARAVLDSEGESDGQGAAGEYDDDESDFEVEEEYYDEEEGEEEMEGEYVQERGGDGLKPTREEVLPEGEGDMLRSAETGESSELRGEDGVAAGQTKEENKENEPFAVPRAGAFYMHDDRFGDNAGARHSRRTFAGRKLWESKDDKKWRHDKFEELNPHGRQYQQWRKSSRGRSWGRGRGRGMGRAHAEGNNWPKTYSYDNQTVAAKHVRGRGPSRYRPLTKHRDNVLPQDTQTVKPLNRTSRTSSARAGISSSYKEPEPFPSNRVASNLSSASPPFYPSASSKEFGVNRKGAQTGNQNRSARPSVVGDKLPKQPPSSSVRGKNVVDTMGIEKFSVNDASSRPLANLHAPHSLSTNASQASHPRDQSRGLSVSGSNSFASPSLSQFNKGRPSAQVHTANQNPAQAQEKRTLPASTHALGLQPGNVSQGPSHAVSGLSMSPLESRDKDHRPESSNSRAALVGKGKGSIQVGGQASFVYSGSQVIGSTGAMGSGHADPNFPGAPTFLPVMQFGAQHPGGIGVPAMGMAFPGYVANPQMGLGNSEMTWLPVLAGAAGALGATYCPPYMAVDGGHHVRPVGQAPSALAISSKDSNADRPNNERKPRLKSEVVTDELSQRQSKPRREKFLQLCELVDNDKVDLSSTVIDEDAPFEEDIVRSLRTSPVHSSKDRTSIDDFEIIKPISRGACGRVFLAKKRITGDLFAIKVLKKADMIRKNAVESILAEHDILISVRNPFVVRFFYSFTCSENLYLVMEYLNGGDLYSLLRNLGCLDEDVARVYIAEVVLALEYLHSLNVVHRDLKPDNLLIAHDGHIKLTDFGLSKVGLINSTDDLSGPAVSGTSFYEENDTLLSTSERHQERRKKRSAVGTPDYLAPEILLGTGHGATADWWSVGIILFELIVGIPPFNAEHPQIIFDNILNRNIPWPQVPEEMSPEAEDLIDKLLTEDPNQRLGAKGASEVKEHPFFRDINWDTLARQKAAFIPAFESAFDTSYFTCRFPWNMSDDHVHAASEFETSSDDGSASGSSSCLSNRQEEMGDECNTGLQTAFESGSSVNYSFSNFSFKNLSQLASINYDLLTKGLKEDPSSNQNPRDA